MLDSNTLVDRRRALGLSQEAVAAAVGVHVRNYGILERRWPCSARPSVLAALAEVLHVPVSQLEKEAEHGRNS